MTGSWPSGSIDHENGDPSDDRWKNLREATPTQQSQNRSARSDSTTGVRGVSRHRRKFAVRIGGKHIGLYGTLDEAKIASDAASRALYGPYAPRR
jgi:hypothetical protein